MCRLVAATLASVLVMAAGAAAQTWDIGKTKGTVKATLSGKTLKISGKGAMANWHIWDNEELDAPPPWFASTNTITKVVIESGVTSIGDFAFYDCTNLKSVTIPNSVTSIGDRAFSGCTGLTSITIPNSVTSIGHGAFAGCTDLTSITIPNSVTSIGHGAFAGCTDLTSITLPNGVTSIGKHTVSGLRSLTSITIPSSVTFIEKQAFSGCTSLTSITVGATVTSISGKDDISNLINQINLAGAEGKTWDCGATKGKVSATFNGGTLRIKGTGPIQDYYYFDGRFRGDGAPWVEISHFITNVVIENGVTSIGKGVFNGHSGLTSITIPNSVTSIEQMAFAGCTGLTSIMIPNGVTSIGQMAFSSCTGLISVTIPNSVTSIEQMAFSGCTGLRSIMVGDIVTSISSADDISNLISQINLAGAEGKTWDCGVTKGKVTATFNGGTLKIKGTGPIKDYYSNLSDHVPWAGISSFITNVVIENGVTSIGKKVFLGCTGLTTITIPNSITSIEPGAISSLTSLIVSNPTPPKLVGRLLAIDMTKACLYVPSNSINAYRSADGWKDFKCIKDVAEAAEAERIRAAQAAEQAAEAERVKAAQVAEQTAEAERIKAAQTAEAERAKAAQAEQARVKKEGRGVLVDGKLKDSRDDKTYTVAKIGNQTWMSENLNYDIPGVTADECYEGKANNCDKYGRLYRWDEANKACPAGWRLPSEADWNAFENYLTGGDMRSASEISVVVATRLISREYGSWAHSGRYVQRILGTERHGWWWSSTEVNAKGVAKEAWSRSIFHSQESDLRRWYKDRENKQNLRSVRCIQE